MAAVNTKKVVIGGLVAGLVMNVIDFIANMWVLPSGIKSDLDHVNPMLWAAMGRTSALIGYVALDFIMGLLLVWLYAAIRPRFGAGPRTAIKAALFFWAFGGFLWYSYVLMGLYSNSSFAVLEAVALVNMIASALVGAKLYSEAE